MNTVIIIFTLVLVGVFGVVVFINQPKTNQTIIPPSSAFRNDSKSTLSNSLQLGTNTNIDQTNPKISPIITPIPTIATSSSQAVPEKPSSALIKTTKGEISISFYTNDAPATIENFAKKAVKDFYTNLVFHRVEDWVVQGGDPKGNGTGGGVMPTELNKKPFVTGSVGVARGQDIRISNDAQFFITKQDSPGLNEQYTNFGIVTAGMDVVEKIEEGDKILEVVVQ